MTYKGELPIEETSIFISHSYTFSQDKSILSLSLRLVRGKHSLGHLGGVKAVLTRALTLWLCFRADATGFWFGSFIYNLQDKNLLSPSWDPLRVLVHHAAPSPPTCKWVNLFQVCLWRSAGASLGFVRELHPLCVQELLWPISRTESWPLTWAESFAS